MKIEIHDAEIELLIRDESGGLAHEMERVADRIIEKARDNLSIPHVTGSLNPAPGPPHLRTGDLRASVQRQFALPGPDGIFIDIFADAEHNDPRNDGQYAATLLEQGYVIISDLDLESLAE